MIVLLLIDVKGVSYILQPSPSAPSQCNITAAFQRRTITKQNRHFHQLQPYTTHHQSQSITVNHRQITI
jgi:hypothetical protein